MPARIMIRPPARPSAGAMTVRRMFDDDARLVRRDKIPRQYQHVINWGNSTPLRGDTLGRLYNNPSAILRASNKRTALDCMAANGVKVPNFSLILSPNRDRIWLARTILNGSGGDGIIVIRPGDPVPRAPLYVQYVKKYVEYRLHVVAGEVIFSQQKKKRNDQEQTADEKLIRNYANGWIFAIADINPPQALKEEAIKAVEVLGLDFGAVDCIMGRDDNQPYILEVNTAPGLSSPTLFAAYSSALKAMLGV